MVSLLTEFHYILKDIPKFDIGKDGFSVKDIYDYYALKHARSPIQMLNNCFFMPKLEKFCKNKDDYEALWMKTKHYSQLLTNLYAKESPPEPVIEIKPELQTKTEKTNEAPNK